MKLNRAFAYGFSSFFPQRSECRTYVFTTSDLNGLAPYQPRILQSSKDRAFYAWSVIKKAIKQTKEKNKANQRKDFSVRVKCCVTSGQQLTASIFSLHVRSTTTTRLKLLRLSTEPKVRVYFRRIVYSGLFIGMNLLSEVTAVHLFNSLGLLC